METRVEVGHAENGATMEIATFIHDGHEYTAMGAAVDLSGGHVYAYITDDTPRVGSLTNWQGNEIGTYEVTSQWTRYSQHFGRYTMCAVRASVKGDSREWYGRYGSDWSQLIHLRPCKG